MYALNNQIIEVTCTNKNKDDELEESIYGITFSWEWVRFQYIVYRWLSPINQ